jgi:nucleotide-binding universal stress UspA family protein
VGQVATTAARAQWPEHASAMSVQAYVPRYTAPTFASIVCGVDGSRPGFEAAHQAAILTDEAAALTYVAVSWEQGTGASAVAPLTHDHAHHCLGQARADARALGVEPALLDEHADNPARRLMELADGHDLLVVGTIGHSRPGGIMVGSAATAVAHRSPVPVLVVRQPPDGVEFPKRILVASDGTPLSKAAVEITARLAARHGAIVAIAAVRDGELPFRPGLVEHAAQITVATGGEPVILSEPGPAHRGVVDAARDIGASLVVTGSRGLSGPSALRSVSERIVHSAPCSVLVLRPRPA